MRIDLDAIRARVHDRQRLRAERRAALRDVGIPLLEPKPRPRRLRAIVARVLPWRKG